MTPKLVDVRCPLDYTSKRDKRIYKCNHLCVRVHPGSAGQAWCSKCQITFEFQVSDQSQATTAIKVQR